MSHMTRISRLTSLIGLALCSGLAFTPIGCGGGQETEATPHGGEGPTIPEGTVAALKACAGQGRDRLKETSYTFLFDVEAMESGQAGRVRLKDSSPGDRAMESCMADALKSMPVPPSVLYALAQQVEVSPQSRGVMGVLALGGVVSLIPALIVVAGVTVVVGVAVVLSKDAIEAVKRRKRERIKEECITECSDSSLPTPDHGFEFWNCVNECMKRRGVVP